MSDAAERIVLSFTPLPLDHGVKIATVITDNPKVTIQLSGSQQALALDFFVVPDAGVYRQGEVMLAYPILGAAVNDRAYVLLPLNTGVVLAVYSAPAESFTVSATGYVIEQKDVQMPAIADGQTVGLLPNRFPAPLWVVVQVF